MPTGPGGLDSNGIWQFGEDNSEALASDLLNLGMGSVSDAFTNLAGVLQVVSVTKTDTFTGSVAADAEATITGLSANITPVSTNSKIYVQVAVAVGESGSSTLHTFNVLRGGTPVGLPDAAGNRGRRTFGGNASSVQGIGSSSASFMDTPSSTSEQTYSVTVGHTSGSSATVYINRSEDDSDLERRPRGISTITLMEVAG